MVCWTAYVPLVCEPSVSCVFLCACGLGVDLCRSVWGYVQCGERRGLGMWGSACVHVCGPIHARESTCACDVCVSMCLGSSSTDA